MGLHSGELDAPIKAQHITQIAHNLTLDLPKKEAYKNSMKCRWKKFI
jgi:hypothetical protein